MITWLDLTVEGDPHPRRFDSPATARAYLLKVERFTDEAADHLLQHGSVQPPLTRREYRLKPLNHVSRD